MCKPGTGQYASTWTVPVPADPPGSDHAVMLSTSGRPTAQEIFNAKNGSNQPRTDVDTDPFNDIS